MSPFLSFATYIGCKGNHKLRGNVTTAQLFSLMSDILVRSIPINILFVNAPFGLWSYEKSGVQLRLCIFLLLWNFSEVIPMAHTT